MGHIIWCHLKRPNKTIQIANCMLHVKMFMQGKILLFYGPSNMHHVCIILYGPYQMESYDVSDKFRIASYKVLSMWFSWIQFLVLSSLVFLKRVESLFKSLWQFSVNIKLCCVTHVIWAILHSRCSISMGHSILLESKGILYTAYTLKST